MKKTILVIVLLTYKIIFSQNSKINSSYTNYFKKEREIPFLHLNKTTFMKGEEIWFKAYMLNQNTKKLHQESTNLHISIFDETGKLHTQKLLLLKKGIGSGNILIDSTFKNTNYYIKASTNWMKNFTEDESYTQKIVIANNASFTNTEINNDVDIQILPEGGHLLKNTINHFGIIIKDKNNKGIKITKGEILNNQNEIIHYFSTNKFGIGKSMLDAKENEKYTLKVTLSDGSVLNKKIPNTKHEGVVISLNEQTDEFTKFTLRTNKQTLPKLINKDYFFKIHNTNSLKKGSISFKADKYQYSFIIKNKSIEYGTNIITFFNEKNIPVAERVFFNYDESLFKKVDIVQSSKNNVTSISIKKNNIDSRDYFLSASILPLKTKSYRPSNSIFSKFLLKPYIKGDIENSNYYFNNINRKKLYELDLLLLTQGWSKYNWNNIFNNQPLDFFSFEKGIDINGYVNVNKTNNSSNVSLMSGENKLLLMSDVKNRKFELTNLFLKDTSSINLFFFDKKKLKQPKIYLQFLPLKKRDKIDISKIEYQNKTNTLNTFAELNSFILKEENMLDEVFIDSKPKFKNKPSNSLSSLRRIKVINSHLKNLKMNTFFSLNNFRTVCYNAYDKVLVNNRNRSSFDENYTLATKVYLDNFHIPFDIESLNNMFVSDFEEIFLSNSQNGEIHLFSKKGGNNKSTPYSSYKVPFGFMVEKEYYQPKYKSFKNDLFNNYGSIYWKPNIKIDNNSIGTSFDFSNLNQEKVIIHIEGITNDGQLINKKQIISLQ